MYKASGKSWIKTPKSPGIEGALFNWEMVMDIYGCLHSSLSLFYLYFVTNIIFLFFILRAHTSSWTFFLSPILVSTLLAEPFLPSSSVYVLYRWPHKNLSDITFFKWIFASYTFLLVTKKQKLILYFFLSTMTSELSTYLNERLGIFVNVKQQKWSLLKT